MKRLVTFALGLAQAGVWSLRATYILSRSYNLSTNPVGAETMYPEYREKVKAKFKRPEKCTLNCG